MKFKIRYADQIVGIFSIAAIGGLVALCFFLGSQQKWFVHKYHFQTEFQTASNISLNMAVQYKGFTIGRIDRIELENDRVEARFYVLEDYINYIKDGSLVELNVSPIGLGTSFVLHPGVGPGRIEEGSFIPRIDSEEGAKIIRQGRIEYTPQRDSITDLMLQVSLLLRNLNGIAAGLEGAINGKGKADAPLYQILSNIVSVTSDLKELMSSISTPDGLVPTLLGAKDKEEMYSKISRILTDVSDLANSLADVADKASGIASEAGGLVEGAAGAVGNADSLIVDVNVQLNNVLTEVSAALLDVQDVLEGIKNNPLIKKGVPDRSRTKSAAPQTRDNEF